MIRVLIGQKGKLMRGAFATVLSRAPDVTVVSELAAADNVIGVAQREAVDVAVLDAVLPASTAMTELCEKLAAQCAVLLLCDPAAPDRLCLSLARLAPRVGFLATESSPELLVAGVRRLAGGETVIDPKLALSVMVASHNPFTGREREVLQLAAEGLRAPEIAKRLFLSPGTVRNHLSRILTKTDTRTRIAAIRAARQRGWS